MEGRGVRGEEACKDQDEESSSPKTIITKEEEASSDNNKNNCSSQGDLQIVAVPSIRRVSFPQHGNGLVTGYLEPADPWANVKPVHSPSELSEIYQKSCRKHRVMPIDAITRHLDSLDWDVHKNIRLPSLNLRNNSLSTDTCETLEEILKRVQYESIDVSGCELDDNSASALFDMVEYYEAANELNISDNERISHRGWQSCANMVKRCQSLRVLVTKRTPISEQNAKNLGNALSLSSIHTLKLEQCGLTGRPISTLCATLSKNTALKELFLASNDLNCYDAFSIALLLKNNIYLQYLDISNNKVQDNGVSHIAVALIEQSAHLQNIVSMVQKTMMQTIKSLSNESLASDSQDSNDHPSSTSDDQMEVVKSPQTPPNTKLEWDKINENDANNNISAPDEEETKSLTRPENEKANVDNADPNMIIDLEKEDKEIITGESRDINENVCEEKVVTNDNDTNLNPTDVPAMVPVESPLIVTSTEYSGDNNSTPTESGLSPFVPFQSIPEEVSGRSMTTERSLSLESLNSEASIESNASNDSKSSIKLAANKFSKTGTLERQSSVPQADMSTAKPTGLQVLVLWNNLMTKKCAQPIADMLKASTSIEILNIGKNLLDNEFVSVVKPSLITNNSLVSLGLQSTHLTCVGAKGLADLIEAKACSKLKRVDLRDNNFQVPGLTAINEALKSNKTLTRIDLDSEPKRFDHQFNGPEHEALVRSIRSQCAYNENQANTESSSTQNRAKKKLMEPRSSNLMMSRKISLTCQSIKPLEPPSSTGPKEILGGSFLDADKKNGGRLRSPLPSPIPSPIASPIPSPSRCRFQVSRVQETDPSLSPLSTTPSPTSVSPSPSSRFRVTTVLEPPKKTKPIPVPIPVPDKLVDKRESVKTDVISKKEDEIEEVKKEEGKKVDKYIDDVVVDESKVVANSDNANKVMIKVEVDQEKSDESQKTSPITSLNNNSNNSSLHIPNLDESQAKTNSNTTKNSRPPERKTSWIPNPATIEKLMSIFQRPSHLFGICSGSSSNQGSAKQPQDQQENNQNLIASSMSSMFSWSGTGGFLGSSTSSNSNNGGGLAKKEDSCPEIYPEYSESKNISSNNSNSSVVNKEENDLSNCSSSNNEVTLVEAPVTRADAIPLDIPVNTSSFSSGSTKIFTLGSSENSPIENNSPVTEELPPNFAQREGATSSFNSLSSVDSYWSLEKPGLGKMAHDSITLLKEHSGKTEREQLVQVLGQKSEN